MIYIGTATWNIPKIAQDFFPHEGSHLERYTQRLNAVEINTSFYRDHQPKTYLKWSEMAPYDFCFSVKLNKRFTHECNLDIDPFELKTVLYGISLLGKKFKVLLVQFPALQAFHREKMRIFYSTIREVYQGVVVLEARNLSWMHEDSLRLMERFKISKVRADPEKCPGLIRSEVDYYRLHGAPELYKSEYTDIYLEELFSEIGKTKKDVWCIFDNTTLGYATLNAMALANKTQVLNIHLP